MPSPKKTTPDEPCIICGETNYRNSETCSPKCYKIRALQIAPKVCPSCETAHQKRGKTCSPECAVELKKKTNLERFGAEWALQTEASKAKRVETNKAKYGADHHLQTEGSLAKLRATNLERYGVEYVGQSEAAKATQRATNLERYGVEYVFQADEVKDKIAETSMERYGVRNGGGAPEVQDRIRRTNQERYGVANAFQADEVKDKIKQTSLERYGVEYPSQAPEVKAKIAATNIDRYGVPAPFQDESVKAKIRATNLARLGFEYPSQSSSVREKGRLTLEASLRGGVKLGRGRVSKLNRELARKIEEALGLNVTFEKAVGDYSFDLGVEGTNIAIELNPTITHNADVPFPCVLKQCPFGCQDHKPKEANAHQKRAKAAQAQGIKLLQFYDWDDDTTIMRFLSSKAEVGYAKHSARKLSPVKLTTKEANSFISNTHPQGGLRGQSHCYGLRESSGKLLAVATFGRARFGAKEEYEWLRYAVADKTIVHGGSGKLFRVFLGEAGPSSVISYVSFDHTTGPTFLSSLNFTEGAPTGPSLMWSNPRNGRHTAHTSLIRQGADRLLSTKYGPREECGMGNEEIMALEGYLRVFTSGNRVFRWTAASV